MALARRDLLNRSPVLEALTQDVVVADLIGEKLFPTIGVAGDEVTIPTFLQGADMRTAMNTIYEEGTEPKCLSFDRNFFTRSLQYRMLDGKVNKKDIRHAQFGFDPKVRVAKNVTVAMEYGREWQYAQLVQNATPDAVYPAANISALTTSAQRWDHVDSNGWLDQDIRAQLRPLSDAINMKIGVRPNVGVCSFETARLLKANKTLRAIYGLASGSASIGPELTLQQVAEVLELREIVVGTAAGFVPGESAPIRLWSSNVFSMFYRNPNPSLDGLSFAYTLWDTTYGKSQIASYVNIPKGGTEFVRREESYDPIITCGQAGACITGLLTGS